MAGFPKAGDHYGRYRIVDEIGHGGMGVVYKAHDTVLDRAVAVKIVLPSLADREEYHHRFALEAAAMAKIPSRHVVDIYDYGEHDDTVYFATQYFPDGDLKSWLAEHGPLERRTALVLVAQVCEALGDAHRAGVVHRDVKPGNVLLWNRPEGLLPYLSDFGIAVEGMEEKRSGLTRTGTLIGSPAYMAPERHFGHPADERGDVYSAGCLLWTSLTGQAPYGGTDFQMMNAHINAPVVTLETDSPVDERIDEVLAGALEKDPDRRFQGPEEMRVALLELVKEIDSGVVAAPTAPLPAPGTVPGAEQDDATAVRPTGAPPGAPPPLPPQRPAPSPEPEPIPVRPAARGRWRWLAPVLVGAAVVVIAALTSAIVGFWDHDDTPVGTPTATGAPVTPDAPQVRSAPGDRAVVFTITPATEDTVLEANQGDGWESVESPVSVETREGGDKACLRVRSVAEGAGQRAVSAVTRSCGNAEPRTAELVETDAYCYGVASNGYVGACRWYAIRMAGFASGTRPLARTRPTTSAEWCPATTNCRRVPVDEDGHADIPRFFRVFSDSGVWVLDVDGVTSRTRLTGPPGS